MSKSMLNRTAAISIILILIFGYGLDFNFVFGDEIQIPTSLTPVGDQSKTYDSRINLPGLINNGVRNDFVSFLKWLFPFMLSVAAILAVLMIVISGAEMVGSAGSESAMKDARDRLQNAILGLILAFAAWLIIQTINPDILKGLL